VSAERQKLSILIVYAHPADSGWEGSGTLAVHADLGDSITSVICTDGERHHPDLFLDAEEAPGRQGETHLVRGTLDELRALKRREAEQIAHIIGVRELIFLGWPDDEDMILSHDRVAEIRDIILRVRPDVVITHMPTVRMMPDDPHTVISQTVMRAIATAGTRIRQIDGVPAHHVKEIFYLPMGGEIADSRVNLAEGIVCDVWIDTTRVIARKVQAIDQLVSQRCHGRAARKVIESRDGRWGMLAGCSYAEPFLRWSGHTYSELPMAESIMSYKFVPNDLPGDQIIAHDVPLASPPEALRGGQP
jgi:LmbE family N-acetylglucosaminyl deacetylase